jgi:hypothetical protein
VAMEAVATDRDDFPARVKEVLAARVGHRCSNPDCCARKVRKLIRSPAQAAAR